MSIIVWISILTIVKNYKSKNDASNKNSNISFKKFLHNNGDSNNNNNFIIIFEAKTVFITIIEIIEIAIIRIMKVIKVKIIFIDVNTIITIFLYNKGNKNKSYNYNTGNNIYQDKK